MAVGGPAGLPADAAAIARQFGIAGDVLGAEPHGSGHINASYRVRCQSASGLHGYLLQRINTAVFADVPALMENIERVTAHLAGKLQGHGDADRRVLTLVRSQEGASWVQRENATCWRMFHFIDDAVTYDRVESVEQARQAARAFGEFQRQLAALPAPPLHATIPGFHDTPARFRAFQQAVEADVVHRAAACQPEIDFLLEREDLAGALLRANLPERVTHNDTKLNNVLFDIARGEPLCVVDLDTVMPGLALYDFGDMVRTATCPAAEDEQDLEQVDMHLPLYQALLEGYAQGTGGLLTATEQGHVPTAGPVITYEQALRFLADHLAGDVYYKTSRPSHNLDRCRTQIKLLQSMERQAEAMGLLANEVFQSGSDVAV